MRCSLIIFLWFSWRYDEQPYDLFHYNYQSLQNAVYLDLFCAIKTIMIPCQQNITFLSQKSTQLVWVLPSFTCSMPQQSLFESVFRNLSIWELVEKLDGKHIGRQIACCICSIWHLGNDSQSNNLTTSCVKKQCVSIGFHLCWFSMCNSWCPVSL